MKVTFEDGPLDGNTLEMAVVPDKMLLVMGMDPDNPRVVRYECDHYDTVESLAEADADVDVFAEEPPPRDPKYSPTDIFEPLAARLVLTRQEESFDQEIARALEVHPL